MLSSLYTLLLTTTDYTGSGHVLRTEVTTGDSLNPSSSPTNFKAQAPSPHSVAHTVWYMVVMCGIWCCHTEMGTNGIMIIKSLEPDPRHY